MKLNPDCIRDILVSVEEMDYNSTYTIQKLHEKLSAYSIEQLNYHCVQMIDAGLINAQSAHSVRCNIPQVSKIFDLTYSGHQFLAEIRSDTIWSRTKDVAKGVGSESLRSLKDIAVSIVTLAVQNKLGLH